MSYTFVSDNTDTVTNVGAKSDLLSRNALTTAGVLVGAGTGAAGAAILVAALPGQMAVAATLSGGLIYAGHRQHVGKPIIPGMSDDKSSAKPAPVANAMGDTDTTADAVPASAVAV